MTTKNAHNFGPRLRTLRTERHLTRKDLAELSGLDPNALAKIENENRWPRPETLRALATALEVSIDDLVRLE